MFSSWSVYDINYRCDSALSLDSFVNYFNKPSVQAAIHAPAKPFQACNDTLLRFLTEEFVQPPADFILPAILERGISIHIYSGDHDFLLNHIGTELVIQNMTWSVPPHEFLIPLPEYIGSFKSRDKLVQYYIIYKSDSAHFPRCNKQGFQSPPNHKFLVDGKVAGYWGAEVRLYYFFFLPDATTPFSLPLSQLSIHLHTPSTFPSKCPPIFLFKPRLHPFSLLSSPLCSLR